MNTTNNNTYNFPARQTVVNGLAVVGFIALIVAGISLAVYSTRYVPSVVNRVGGAAVYLGSVFTPAKEPSLSVVSTPIASTTISFGTASSAVSTSTSISTAVTAPKPMRTTAGPSTNTTYQIGSGPATVAPYGLSDLAILITAVGYLETTSADSFVASATVPSGSLPAVKFTIKNVGTNWTGTWRFNASIPTRTSYVFESGPQQSLAPGDSIDYTLGFDRANSGPQQMVTIIANFDHAANESDTANDSISVYLNIL